MTEDDGVEVDFGEFSLSVLIGLFVIATIGSAGSILLLGEFTPTPPGAVQGALGQYINYMVFAVTALIIAEGMDFLSKYLNEHSPIDMNEHTGRSTVYNIIVWSLMLVASWNVVVLLLSPVGKSLVPYQSPQFMVWTLATKFSLDAILPVAALVIIISVVVLFLRLLSDLIICGMDIYLADGK